jgi:hypothetical protein
MSAAFTPGPWWLDRDADDHEHEYELLGRGEETVCALQHFGRKSTAEANARLIAAAPKLYSELKAAAAIFRSYEALHLQKGTDEGDQKAAVNAAYAETFERTLAEIESDQ